MTPPRFQQSLAGMFPRSAGDDDKGGSSSDPGFSCQLLTQGLGPVHTAHPAACVATYIGLPLAQSAAFTPLGCAVVDVPLE